MRQHLHWRHEARSAPRPGADGQAFLVCVGVVLAAVVCLAIYVTFFADFGPLSEVLGAVFLVVFMIGFVALQLGLRREMADQEAFSKGPLAQTLAATKAALNRDRRKKREPPE